MKKYLVLILPFIMSCGQTIDPSNVNRSTKVLVNNNTSIKGANLSVNLNFGTFKTKANVPGSFAVTVDKAIKVKLYLRTFDTVSNQFEITNPLKATTISYASGILDYPKADATPYVFYNIQPGTYYVVAEMFSDIGATTNVIEPLVYTGDTATGFTNGKRGLAISKNYATVSSDFYTVTYNDFINGTVGGSISSVAGFNIFPQLKNAVGASIDTSATVVDGTPASNSTINLN